jgi:peptidyl-tRNA hydrolase, PTH1 family
MKKRFCVIGLGNPDKYALTRHNYGKDFVQWVSQDLSLPFITEKKSKYFILHIDEHIEVLFLVTNSFMNTTGDYINKATSFIDNIENIIIVHDDLEVPFGNIKLRIDKNRGIRGHNGIRSIVFKLYSLKKFSSDKKNGVLPYFLSLGIGRSKENISISDYVLSKFDAQEKSKLTLIYKKTYLLIKDFLNKPEKANLLQTQ